MSAILITRDELRDYLIEERRLKLIEAKRIEQRIKLLDEGAEAISITSLRTLDKDEAQR